MKNLLIISFLSFGMITTIYAQDTIIDTKDYYLQIHKYIKDVNPFAAIDSSQNTVVFEHRWNGHPLTYALKHWMTVLELDTMEYRIDESVVNQKDYYKFINKDGVYTEPIPLSDSSRLEHYLDNDDFRQITYYAGYSMIYQQKHSDKKDKAIAKAALTAFCELEDLEIETVKRQVNYWKLEIIDTVNASFSYDQDAYWKRTDLEEYIYYERIGFKRVVDLLSRKLDAFVEPISYTTKRFDIRMPHSYDVFDLKYAMIEHGLELTEVSKEIDMIVIRKKD